MILVLAGTKDGRIIAERLSEKGFRIIATTVTPHGNKFSEGIKVQVGALDITKLSAMIERKDIKLIIDATHPFAKEISEMAIEVCQKLKVPYLRYERKSFIDNTENIIWARDFNEAAIKLKKFDRIFLATGSKNLDIFLPLKAQGKKVFARVLPTSNVVKKCEDLGFSVDEIIAMQGPFSCEMNISLFRQTRCDIVVTKESGKVGGLKEKIQAAKKLDIPIMVIKRPKIEYPIVFNDINKLIVSACKAISF